MPSTVKVRVKAARNLPVMDRASSAVGGGGVVGRNNNNHHSISSAPSTDAYVQVTLGGHSDLLSGSGAGNTDSSSSKQYSARTKVCRRSLFPVWDEEFRFDVSSDTLLQEEPLIFKVCDSETLSYDESIGLVYLDLNPLLTQTAKDSTGNTSVNSSSDDLGEDHPSSTDNINAGMVDGWFPLYDPLSGVRGELEISVKLTFIGDVNPYKDSSAGVQLFPFSTIDPASGYTVSHIIGFVEELVVADDPEFEWNDRKSRTSHETRQTLLYMLDASVRRRMCKTVLEEGGNAVLGYHQVRMCVSFKRSIVYKPFCTTRHTPMTARLSIILGASIVLFLTTDIRPLPSVSLYLLRTLMWKGDPVSLLVPMEPPYYWSESKTNQSSRFTCLVNDCYHPQVVLRTIRTVNEMKNPIVPSQWV